MTEDAAAEVPVRRASAWVRTRLLGALATLVAAALAIVGSFQPLVAGDLTLQGRTLMTVTITGWTLSAHGPAEQNTPVSTFGGAAKNGIPLTIAAATLIAVVLLLLVAAPRSTPAALRVAAVAGVAIAVAFLVGVLLTLGVQAANLLGSIRPIGGGAQNSDYQVSAGFGAGFWLEVAAGVLAITAVVLTALPGSGPPRAALETGDR